MSPAKGFKPWRKQKWAGFFMIIIQFPLFFVYLAVYSHDVVSGWTLLLLILASILVAKKGASLYSSALRRQYGARVEEEGVLRLLPKLTEAGFDVKHNVQTNCIGDIDLVVDLRLTSIPIEIKSFGSWGTAQKREERAVIQAKNQAKYLSSIVSPIIWLPKIYEDNVFLDRGCIIVTGSADMVVEVIESISRKLTALRPNTLGRRKA